jgi:predicted amidohydrolase
MIFLTRLKTKPPIEGAGIRFAIYQGERPVGTPAALQDNLAKLDEIVREAKQYGVQLISFPELYLEGYTLTPELIKQLAEPVDGPSISRVAAIARAHHISIICPYAERDNRGGEARYYDAIAVLGADGTLLHNYRKTHLFGAAERINYTFGYAEGTEDPFRVPLVAGFPVGVLNLLRSGVP